MPETQTRPTRQPLEFLQGEVRLPPHPDPAELRDPHWLVSVIPVLGIGVMALFYLLRATTDSANSALFAVPLLLLAVFTVVGTIAANRWRKRDYAKQNVEKTLDYVRLMHSKRARLQAAYDAQRNILAQHFPPSDEVMQIVLSPAFQMTGKHVADPSFGMMRLGVGRIPLSVKVQTPDPDQHRDRVARAFKLANDYRFVDDAPVVISLRQHAPIGMLGSRDRLLATSRTMISQLIWSHTASNLQIVVFAPQIQHEDWDWLRWLPHTGNGAWLAFETDSVRRNLAKLGQQLDSHQYSDKRYSADADHILVIFDNMPLDSNDDVYQSLLNDAGSIPTSTIHLAHQFEQLPVDCRTIIEVHDDGKLDAIGTHDNQLQVLDCDAETISHYDAQLLARAISAQRVRQIDNVDRIPTQVDFLALYGVEQVEQMQRMIHLRWGRDLQDEVLPFPVPIGREGLSAETYIHLSDEQHGPHGVLAGTTGSGKSELLQTLVASLAIEHHPDWLNFLLIDFKGGSTFNTFKSLPHTVGTVTNLDGVQIQRVLDALKSEIDTRQRQFKRTNVRDIRQYYRFYASGNTDYPALPHLFIIIDEFAQLAKDMPDFLAELVRTAQLGRSLGIHLLLATQSPMDIITDEINANLQFRICLRVQNVEASRAMLKRPDAAYLPPQWVGRGFLQVGERGLFKQFQTAYLGDDYNPSTDTSDLPVLEILQPSSRAINLLPDLDLPADANYYAEPFTTGHAIVQAIRDYSERHNIRASKPLLLPPLPLALALNNLQDHTLVGGWTEQGWRPMIDRMSGTHVPIGNAPIGKVDNVYHRDQSALWVQLSAHSNRADHKDGHVLVIGSPNSGKTTTLQTIALSQARMYDPDSLHMYFLSFSDASLNQFAQTLPHAERVIHGTESERVRRLFRRLINTLQERETGHAASVPRIVVFIDQYEQFRDMYFDQHMGAFDRLLSEGRAAGIFMILTTSAISAVSERMRSLIQQRIMLRATDPTDYLIAIGAQVDMADEVMPPGRGIVAHNPPLPIQISLPQLGLDDLSEDTQSVQALLHQMQGMYQALHGRSQSPLPIDEMPTQFKLSDLQQPSSGTGMHTALGVTDDDRLSRFTLHWYEQGPHYVVTGPPSSGKTNLLKAAALAAAGRQSPEQLRLILVDLSRRSFSNLVNLKHVIAHITQVEDFIQLMARLEADLANQADSGIQTIIMIDNYDMLTEALGGDPRLIKQLRALLRNYDADNTLSLWVSSHFEHIGDPLLRHLLLQRSGFAFGSKENLYGFNVRTTHLPNEIMPQGRAFFVQYATIETVQLALVSDIADHVAHLNQGVWADAAHAAWTVPDAPSQPAPPENTRSSDSNFDIDTAGLIEDLLGGDDE